MNVPAAETASADALYEPFAPFAEWRDLRVNIDAWSVTVSRLAAMRTQASVEAFQSVLVEVTRAAAIDTGAIEGLYATDRGFTETMAKEHAFLEAIKEHRGEDVAALISAQMDGFEMVLDAATATRPVHAAWLRELHATITRAQQTYQVTTRDGLVAEVPLPHGVYKQSPNHVRLHDGGTFAYAPVHETPHEVDRLVRELESDDFKAAAAPLQSAYAHYAFIRVHPFSDGNGRVARALASLYLYRAASTPFLLFAADRGRYLTALRAADAGNVQAFVTFVESRAIETVQLAAEQLQAAGEGDLRALTAALGNLVTAQGGLTQPEVDALLVRVADEFETQIRGVIGELTLPAGAQITAWRSQGSSYTPPDGFRYPQDGHLWISVTCQVGAPYAFASSVHVDVLASTDRRRRDLVALRERDTSGEPLGVDLSHDDVYPELGDGARLRIHTLAKTAVARVLGNVVRNISMRTGDAIG